MVTTQKLQLVQSVAALLFVGTGHWEHVAYFKTASLLTV